MQDSLSLHVLSTCASVKVQLTVVLHGYLPLPSSAHPPPSSCFIMSSWTTYCVRVELSETANNSANLWPGHFTTYHHHHRLVNFKCIMNIHELHRVSSFRKRLGWWVINNKMAEAGQRPGNTAVLATFLALSPVQMSQTRCQIKPYDLLH